MRRAVTLALLSGIGLLLRAWCFVGWGLGDDGYYARIATMLGRGQFDLTFGSNYRFGLHLPNAAALKLFGTSDLAYVLFPLLCSLATIAITGMLGQRLAGLRAGLLAAALVATSPFDLVYSTTMTIDVIVSFLCGTALLLVTLSEQAPAPRGRLGMLLAALLLFQAYLVKIPALLFLAVLVLYSSMRRPLWRRHATLYLALAALLVASMLADLAVTGDALGYWHGELRTAPRFEAALDLKEYLLYYPREMFGATLHGTRPFGYTFYAVAAALVYAWRRRLPGTALPTLWLVGLFLLLEFLPNRAEFPYQPLPRFTRYLQALIVPGVLLIAIALDDWLRRSRRLALVALGVLIAASLVAARRTANLLQDSFADERQASRYLLAQPPNGVYSDSAFLDRLDFDRGYQGPFELRWLQARIERRRTRFLLRAFDAGYAVTGGSRGPGVWQQAIFDLGALEPPRHWRLLHTLPYEPRPWRGEPLRIFEILPH